MEETQKKKFDIMPYHIGKFFHQSGDKPNITMRVMIIICIFSLILIFIGTLILLNSYNPHATSVSSMKVKQLNQPANTAPTINIPSSTSKAAMLSLEDNIQTYSTTLAQDETAFENILK